MRPQSASGGAVKRARLSHGPQLSLFVDQRGFVRSCLWGNKSILQLPTSLSGKPIRNYIEHFGLAETSGLAVGSHSFVVITCSDCEGSLRIH